ncbi:retrovirus-related pol polyprotein LINE-1 [Tanacetum coccineum]
MCRKKVLRNKLEVVEELLEEEMLSMEDEEVPFVDGVFEFALGALEDESCCLGVGEYSHTRRGGRVASSRRIRVGSLNVGTLTVGLGEAEKKSFWDSLDDLVRECSMTQQLIVAGDVNGHIGANADGFSSVHGGFGYGVRNEEVHSILEFDAVHDLVVINSFFKKRDAHLITFHSGDHDTHNDYMLVRKGDLRLCKYCKVFSGKVCFSQHRLLALDIYTKRRPHSMERAVQHRILWKNLYGEAAKAFRARVIEGVTSDEEDRLLISLRGEDEANRSAIEKRYKEAKREAKKAVSKAKEKAYEDMYKRLDSKEGENDIYRIAKARDRRKRDLGIVRFIKDEDGRSSVNEDVIRRRWKEHKEVKEALRKMGRNNAMGPDEIPIEAWRCLGGEGVRSLIEKYRERQKDLHLAFLDLEKAYDSVPQELIWKTLSDKGTPTRYIKVIHDMYKGARTCVRTPTGNTKYFPVDVDLHQGLAISPYLFALILHELTKGIQESIPWCLIFADDIVLISETRGGAEWKIGAVEEGSRRQCVALLAFQEFLAYRFSCSSAFCPFAELLPPFFFAEGACIFPYVLVVLLCLFACFSSPLSVFLEVVPLPLGRGVTVYISPPPYLVFTGLGNVVVVVDVDFWSFGSFGNRSSSGCHGDLWWLKENEEDGEVVVIIWREFI